MHRSRPPTMMPSRPHSASHSSMLGCRRGDVGQTGDAGQTGDVGRADTPRDVGKAGKAGLRTAHALFPCARPSIGTAGCRGRLAEAPTTPSPASPPHSTQVCRTHVPPPHLCVVSIMEHCLFWVAMRAMTFHMKRRATGSMPVDGSSVSRSNAPQQQRRRQPDKQTQNGGGKQQEQRLRMAHPWEGMRGRGWGGWGGR
jgi:hypothetical protein